MLTVKRIHFRRKVLFVIIFFIALLNSLSAEVYPRPVVTICPFLASSMLLYPSPSEDFLEMGNGLMLGCGMANIFIHHLYAQLSADFEISNPRIEDINYHNFYNFVLSLGYQFPLLDSLLLVPAIGTGVVFQHTTLGIYYSPVINIGASLDINLIKNHHLFFSFDTSFLIFGLHEPLFRFQLGFMNHYQVIPEIPEKTIAAIRINPPLFSPDGDGYNDLAEIAFDVTSFCKIKHWYLSILDPHENIFISFTGKGSVPEKVMWDGHSVHGKLVEPETNYNVMLQLYDELNRETITRSVIITDTLSVREIPKESKVSIRITPRLFSPDNDNNNDLAEIWPDVTAYCRIDRWTLTILDPEYHDFYFLSGEGEVPKKITWDGHSTDGDLVESAMEYYVNLSVYDEYNRKAEANQVIYTDILVMKKDDRINTRIQSITFAPYSASLFINDSVEKTTKNIEILNRLVELFTQYKDYTIRIEGHANHLDWEDPEKKRIEQETILLPLSLKRAQVVKDSLVILGIEEDRISVFGYGGDVPLVPFDDIDNRWKNRRVEFVLIRNSL
ncbi:MAG: OmpA family protein [Spirochaetales bacterium]|nr:OmpA family protein [Spirochaetales bacterium]